MNEFWNLLEEALGKDFARDKQIQADVRELSKALTSEREQTTQDYLEDPEMQRAYLAYYLPLNFEKIRTLLTAHAGVWPATVPSTQRWIDLGCGPGTATLAAMASLKTRYKKEHNLPRLRIELVDAQSANLESASTLIEGFAERLGLEVELGLHQSLASALQKTKKNAPFQLTLAANVLNEMPAEGNSAMREPLLQLWDQTDGVFFVLEPGHRVSSQRLVRFRERLLKQIADPNSFRVLGPCPHVERCPVYRSKHWCHFSEPVAEKRLTDLNMKIFKNPRGWLKFSYLLFKKEAPLPSKEAPGVKIYRAIGDLHPSGPGMLAIDLCQPVEKRVLRLPTKLPPELREGLVRGATVRVHETEDRVASARPLTRLPTRDRPAATPLEAVTDSTRDRKPVPRDIDRGRRGRGRTRT